MIYGGWEIIFEVALKPVAMGRGVGARPYSVKELEEILRKRQMKIMQTFSDYYGTPASPKEMQLIIYSVKE